MLAGRSFLLEKLTIFLNKLITIIEKQKILSPVGHEKQQKGITPSTSLKTATYHRAFFIGIFLKA